MTFLFGLAIIVVCALFHELGHYLVARLFGVPVITLSLGLGPRIWKKKIGGTFYALSILPIGAYVLPLGSKHGTAEKDKKDRPKRSLLRFFMPPAADELAYAEELAKAGVPGVADRSPWVRTVLFAAGPLVNVLLSYLCIFWLVFYVAPRQPNSLGLRTAAIVSDPLQHKQG